MSAFGIYKMFASAMLFVVWATQIVSIASSPNPDDFVFNYAVYVPFVERVADKYVGDCLAYGWVHAYDGNHPSDATAITTTDVSNHFFTCISTARSWIEGNLDYVQTVDFSSVSVVCTSWNHCVASGPVQITFSIPLSAYGFSSDVVKTYAVSTLADLVATDMNYVVIGTGREQYRIVVTNGLTGEVEVNGDWPR